MKKRHGLSWNAGVNAQAECICGYKARTDEDILAHIRAEKSKEFCRACNAPLEHLFIDLGSSPAANSFLDSLEECETYYPLRLYVCHNCWLVQLAEYKKATEIFTKDYVYYSSESPANVSHAKEYVDMAVGRFGLKEGSIVYEIGSNDGYLLQHFPKGIQRVGIDPAWGPAKKASAKGIPVIVDFWNMDTAKRLAKADLICGINVLAHQPDLNGFIEAMAYALKPDGVITQEFPHLMNLVDKCQFDTIYHEHYSYFSFMTICEIFHRHKLAVFDVDRIPEHGGSLRIYARHEPCAWFSTKTACLLMDEQSVGMNSLNYYKGFQERVEKIRADFMRFLYGLSSAPLFVIDPTSLSLDELMDIRPGKIWHLKEPAPPIITIPDSTIVAYGAAAKGVSLLNYCGIRSDLVKYVIDRSPHKQGKYLPGSRIPVVSEAVIKEDKPNYILILPWNLKEEIMQQLSYIKEWGGRFVTAIPGLEVI